MSEKKVIATRDALSDVVARLRRDGNRIAFSNGCFEILHVGHLRSLQDARRKGDCLIVAVNSDDSVARYKDREEPLVPEHERAEILGGFACVHFVLLFVERAVDRLLVLVPPDAYCKGPEYTMENLPERETLKRIGVPLVQVGDPKDHSTSSLFRRITGRRHPRAGIGTTP